MVNYEKYVSVACFRQEKNEVIETILFGNLGLWLVSLTECPEKNYSVVSQWALMLT